MRRSILIILVLFVVFALGGCARLSERAGERLVEGLLENSADSSGGDVDVDFSEGNMTIETQEGDTMEIDYSGNAEWPDDMPDTIPKLDLDITSVINVGGGWMVTCEGASADDYDNYLDDLYAAGFVKELDTSADTGKSITGKVGDLYVMLTYSTEGYLTLSVTQQ